MGMYVNDLKDYDPITVAKLKVRAERQREADKWNQKLLAKPTDKHYEHMKEWKPYNP